MAFLLLILWAVYTRPGNHTQIQRTLGTAEERETLGAALRRGRKPSTVGMFTEDRFKDVVLCKLQLSGYQNNHHFKGRETESIRPGVLAFSHPEISRCLKKNTGSLISETHFFLSFFRCVSMVWETGTNVSLLHIISL